MRILLVEEEGVFDAILSCSTGFRGEALASDRQVAYRNFQDEKDI
jgi:hypothetical protein